MEKNDDLMVAGYQFATVADAEAARQDEKRAKSLEARLDYRNPQNVLAIYHKALETKLFQTPVGYAYLLKVQEHLKKCGIPEEKINPVFLNTTFSNKTERNRSVRESVAARKGAPEFRGRFRLSLGINILLVAMVVVMFFMAMNSESPNILNYRQAVRNEYAAWEQELTEREQALRIAESQK